MSEDITIPSEVVTIPTDPALTALQNKEAADLTTEQAAIVALAARLTTDETRITADEGRITKLEGGVVVVPPPPPPPPTGGPFISAVVVTPTTDGATINWSLSPAGTGQVAYGPTSAHGSLTPKESNLLSAHRQTITGQAAGAVVHFSIATTDAAGSTNSPDATFTVLGSVVVVPPPPPPPPATGTTYGPAIGHDGLANTTLWVGSTVQSYRFRAGQTSPLKTCKIYRLGRVPDPGYTLGTGGPWTAEIHADDGTGHPALPALAKESYAASAVDNAGFIITFASPVTPVAGKLYHLVFTNTDSDPSSNYWAPDGLFNPHSSPQQPKYPDTDWAWLYSDSINGPWTWRNEQIPILDIGYANGQHEGVGYMELSYSGDTGIISGSGNMIREAFTPSVAQRVTGVSVYLRRVSGSDPLSILLETAAGVAIETVTIPASAIPMQVDIYTGWWASVAFSSAHILAAGTGYHVRLSCPSSSTYAMNSSRKGSVNYGYSPQTEFSDGQGQKTTDGGSSWPNIGRTGQDDLQFYFTVK